jgi:flagellin-like hook-associated protein FlgL
MGITISNNGAVQRASYHLADAQEKFQLSIRRLASGKRIISSNEDSGTLAVAMKTRSKVNQLVGAANNVRSGIGFLEIQDGLLDTAAKILMRMSELKGYSTQDPLKSESDTASYNNEFQDLQKQLYDISTMDFNGQSIFAKHRNGSDSLEGIFGADKQDDQHDNTIDIFTSSKGSEGTKVSLHKSLFLSALIVANDGDRIAKSYYDLNTADKNTPWATLDEKTVGWDPSSNADDSDKGFITLAKSGTLASDGSSTLLNLDDVKVEALELAIDNIVFLRSQTGGGMSRLQFAMDTIATQETNMRSALGRIEDVDMASESANLAKYGILMQASAAMVTQANLSNEVALTLIRGM